MGAGHGHHAPAAHAGSRHRGRLWAAFVLLAAFTAVEFAAGLMTGSLALLSDAVHLFTDVLGIGMALAAIAAAGQSGGATGRSSEAIGQSGEAAGRPSEAIGRPGGGTPGGQRTFGLYRLEVLAALGNAILLAGVAGYVLVEAVRRLANPAPVLAGPMVAVALAGLAANTVAFALLRHGARESLNVRGAYLEVLGDLLASVGVLAAAAIIWLTGWEYADPIVAVAVALFIAPRTWALARAAVRVLVQAAPAHLDVAAVERTLAAVPGVADVHDLHVWTLTSGMEVASAHLTIACPEDLEPVLANARQALRDRYGITHATLQVEPLAATADCHEAGW